MCCGNIEQVEGLRAGVNLAEPVDRIRRADQRRLEFPEPQTGCLRDQLHHFDLVQSGHPDAAGVVVEGSIARPVHACFAPGPKHAGQHQADGAVVVLQINVGVVATSQSGFQDSPKPSQAVAEQDDPIMPRIAADQFHVAPAADVGHLGVGLVNRVEDGIPQDGVARPADVAEHGPASGLADFRIGFGAAVHGLAQPMVEVRQWNYQFEAGFTGIYRQLSRACTSPGICPPFGRGSTREPRFI